MNAVVGELLMRNGFCNNLMRNVNLTLARSFRSLGRSASLGGYNVPCPGSTPSSVRLRFGRACHPDNPCNTTNYNRTPLSTPRPTVLGTVCGTANTHVAHIPTHPRGILTTLGRLRGWLSMWFCRIVWWKRAKSYLPFKGREDVKL